MNSHACIQMQEKRALIRTQNGAPCWTAKSDPLCRGGLDRMQRKVDLGCKQATAQNLFGKRQFWSVSEFQLQSFEMRRLPKLILEMLNTKPS